MRTLDQNILNLKQGLEPILVVGILWDGLTQIFYSDISEGPLQGKILNLGEMGTSLKVDGSGTASDIQLKLDDTDGSIKGYVDTIDIYLKPVFIYQWFRGTPLNLGCKIYEGSIAGPVIWNEVDRTIELSCTTRRANIEVGFSAEESYVTILNQKLIGQAWPMPFGTPIHYPALSLQEIPTGLTKSSFGLPDYTLLDQIAANIADATKDDGFRLSNMHASANQDVANDYWFHQHLEVLRARLREADLKNIPLIALFEEQSAQFSEHNVVYGGYKFPQHKPVLCKIGDALFLVKFLGDGHIPTQPNAPCPVSISPFFNYATLKEATGPQSPKHTGIVSVPGGFQWFSAGSQVSLVDDFDFKFAASILPGTVLTVSAYRSYNGFKKLTQLPDSYYTIEVNGPITYIRMKRPLSIISYLLNGHSASSQTITANSNNNQAAYVTSNPDWEDQIYITFQSDLGPNVVDIMAWLILTYTPFQCDLESFNSVREKVANYPANFVLLERKQVDDLLNDIAYQSRCSLTVKNGKYYILYLSEEPDSIGIITLDDVIEGTFKISTTPIEDITTKYIATWKIDYSPDYADPNKIILKNNHLKYGYVEEEHDFYIYNQYYLVHKSALFWSIRKSNVWKIVELATPLHKLNIEAEDCVDLYLPALSPSPVKGIVTDNSYNSEDYSISMTIWTPIRIGTLIEYQFAWPSSVNEFDYYAPDAKIQGGGSIEFHQAVIAAIDLPPYTPIESSVDWSNFGSSVDEIHEGYAKAAEQAETAVRTQQEINARILEENGKIEAENIIAQHAQGEAENSAAGIANATASQFSLNQTSDLRSPVNNQNQANSNIPKKQEIDEDDPPTYERPLDKPSYQPDEFPPAGGVGGGVFPGQIISGEKAIFQVKAYLSGLGSAPTTVTVNEVHGDQTLKIDPNVWVMIFYLVDAYYLVMPSWSH